LGEIVVDEKPNEITAIPKLLDLVDVEGAVMAIDAMDRQTDSKCFCREFSEQTT
jgi:predicted transposase YbfD/YdcC